MSTFVPSLLDKLLGEGTGTRGSGGPHSSSGAGVRFSIKGIKDSVARDIELLLNAHAPYTAAELVDLPLLRQSLLTLGLPDISSLSMASDRDRAQITEALRKALADHDKRLTQVDVRVRQQAPGEAGLAFAIRAQLTVKPNREAVSFDAVMQPGSQRCSVSEAGRPSPAALPAPLPGA
jgi:type VI secretion system protein ImpF